MSNQSLQEPSLGKAAAANLHAKHQKQEWVTPSYSDSPSGGGTVSSLALLARCHLVWPEGDSMTSDPGQDKGLAALHPLASEGTGWMRLAGKDLASCGPQQVTVLTSLTWGPALRPRQLSKPSPPTFQTP